MTNQKENTVIVVVGPTAVGKTSLAIELADYFGTEIISADSRQCYQELNIGVAKPSNAELEQVHHYFIDSHSIHEEVNAALFEQYALRAAEIVFEKNKVAIMVGGTGLYIKSFCEGIDNMPPIDEAIRKQIIIEFENQGIQWLQNELQQKDPAFWRIAEQHNPHRLMRALEILYQTGQSITVYRQQKKIQRSFNIIKVGLELPKEQLYDHINTRVDRMMQEGLLEEVASLYGDRGLQALQTVGYKELFAYIERSMSKEEAVLEIKKNTRHYAKRQMTWFKKDPEIQWVHPLKAMDFILSRWKEKTFEL